MLYYKNGQWYFAEEIVKYIQNGEEITQYVGGEGHIWWIDFADKWEHTEIIEFIPVVPTEKQIARLKEVNQFNILDGFGAVCGDYVEHGIFPAGLNHPLITLQLKKENEQQGIAISEREINEIILGMQVSDLEIQILELQLGGI